MGDPRKLAIYETGLGKSLHTAAAERQVEIIKQNDQIIALLSEVVRLLGQPRA